MDANRKCAAMRAEIKENTSKRAEIEGSNSALKRSGLNKLKVRGKTKSTVVCGLKVIAQNIKCFIKYIRGGYKAKISNIPIKGITVPLFS